jgi:hypothetical protein
MKKITSFLAAAIALGLGTAGAAAADGASRLERRVDRIEHRLDRRGDRIEQRLDRRGYRI